MAEDTGSRAVTFFQQRLAEAGMVDARVILFGSHARGSADSDSDIDIAIISSAFRGKDIFERARLTKDAEVQAIRHFMRPFDVVTLTPEEFEGDSMLAGFVRSAMDPPA